MSLMYTSLKTFEIEKLRVEKELAKLKEENETLKRRLDALEALILTPQTPTEDLLQLESPKNPFD